MPPGRKTLHVDPDSAQMLRRIAAETGEKQYQVLTRLLIKELRFRERQQECRVRREAVRAAEAERLRTQPRIRTFRYDFPPTWHCLHIPAIAHGFQTNHLGIRVLINDDNGQHPLWPYALEITPAYTIKITFVQSHAGGTVLISGWQDASDKLRGLIPSSTDTLPMKEKAMTLNASPQTAHCLPVPPRMACGHLDPHARLSPLRRGTSHRTVLA